MKTKGYKLFKKQRIYTNKRWIKYTAMLVLVGVVGQICFPTTVWALTSGPQQPEASNFTPADVSNLVDPFTGDFSYNIPMFEIGGYPVNLSYNSGVTMDQEATWTGLGWNLNTGAITRDVRGLPDDFWGDEIKRDFNTKPNITAGGTVAVGAEFAGADLDDLGGSASYGIQMKYNNYAGFSVGQTLNGGLQFPSGVNLNLGLSTTNGGLDINPNVSFSAKLDETAKANYKGSLGFGLNINSRTGISQMSLNASVSASKYSKNHNTQGKLKTASAALGGGGSISFLNPTYTPQNTMPYSNFNFSGSFKIGGAVLFGDISGTISGFYSEQKLMTTTMTNPSYGYIYSEKGQYVDNATHDFNREKDGPFTNNTPTLPLTNYTYDAFNIKAQGIGGSFRGFRNDVGHVFDQDMINPSAGGSFGLEVDLGNAVDIGIDVNVNWNESKSGKWKDSNPVKDQLRFRDPQGNNLNENVFFKMVGEKVGESDPTYLNTLQNDKAVRVALENEEDPMTINKLYSDNTNNTVTPTNLNNNNFRNGRMIRNTSIQCFTVADVKQGFPVYTKYLPACAKDHHIGLIVVTTADGTRYIFGLPAYNKVKREVTFAVGGNIEGTVAGLTPDPATNMVTYNSQASINNQNGIDNYYDMTSTAPFVYTWYLTEVLSPDYSDLSGDGATPDDLGGYVKFNYGVEHSNGSISANIPNYQWRTPSGGNNKATYSEGLKTISTDEKGTYLYGVKDIWYPNSIESKTQLVKFEYSDRHDGFGVTGEHNSIGGNAQQKIDKINIFSRQDYVLHPSSAIPLKTIHFEYDYSLCKGVLNNPNANEGKLTLKKVFFTYRNSQKAKYSAYSFEYPGASDPDNPDYDPTDNDRWGTFRDNTTNTGNGYPKNEDYPYTLQDKATAPGVLDGVNDDLSKAWNLKAINLPTGGKINVEYESDDYAYVQDKKACRMFNMIGATSTEDGTPTNDLFTRSGAVITNNNYLVFELESPITGSETYADAIVKAQYFDDPNDPQKNGPDKFLYFRFLLNANNGNEPVNKNEYVSGYADVSDGQYCGVWTGGSSSGPYTKGWIKLKELPNDGLGAMYQQISKAGWAFSRMSTPFYANNQPVPGQSDPGDFIKTILNADIIAQLIQFFQGPNNKMQTQGFASKFVPQSSWVRLFDPNSCKSGGGHRVKKITISDNWENMESNEDGFQYGQEYVYNSDDGKSYGVASFEPMYGADENPFRIPVFYNKTYGPLVPDDRFYQEEPFGESFFPSPGIGYSQVKIMNLQRPDVTKTATGYTIKEFYTAKDFPTITKRTNLDAHRAKIDPILAIFSPYVFDFMATSQGFSIELNDMHGKPKKESVFQEGNDQEPISKVDHFYKVETFDETQVNNKVLVLEKDGNLSEHEIGTEVDMVSDFRENSSFAGNIDLGFNTDYMQFGPIPLIILAVFPKVKFEDTRFRSASVTKVINRYGIEVRTEASDLGSQVMKENMLYNGISGEPLSTRVNNEYDDERYTLSVPAYWAYTGMSHGSQNEGLVLHTTVANNIWDRTNGKINTINGHNPQEFLEPGDELIRSNYSFERVVIPTPAFGNNYMNRVWVSQKANGDLYLIDQYGAAVITNSTEPIEFKLVRSGHRNVLNPKISEYATLKKPVTVFDATGTLDIDNSTNVLSVTAQTFHEQWKSMKRVDNCLPYSVCNCTTTPWAAQFAYVIQNSFSNGSVYYYDPLAPSFNAARIPLYNGITGFQNGFNQPLLDDLMQNLSGCTLTTATELTLFNANFLTSDWEPFNDVPFINGTVEYSFGISWSRASGCVPCSKFGISIIEPSAVPNNYFNPINCDPINGSNSSDILFVPVIINGLSKMIQIRILGGANAECQPLRDCTIFEYLSHDDNIGDPVNPYIKNILGKWRSSESYTLIEDRKGGVDVQVDLRTQGYINGYSDFWAISAGSWIVSPTLDGIHWKRTTTMTQYHPSGPQIEEKNALEIYSAAQYGYFEQLAVAVAQNAQYKEIGFDGFEDYDYLDGTTLGYSQCSTKLGHFRFNITNTDIATDFAHTGKRCVKTTSSVNMLHPLQPITGYRITRDVPYLLQVEDLAEYFGPAYGALTAKEFVLSFWTRQSNYSPVMFTYNDVNAEVSINGGTNALGTVKKSPIIDGWQKFEYTFTIAAGLPSNSSIKIILNAGNGVTGYFDDVRVHPFNSMMKSYVYDPSDLRFMAELDENNYATFYEYDEDGALIRVKKETERGVMTIQEKRYGSYKN